ncbi:hypothetical protein G6O69_36825 [Pseudenhygromyxa sp. WMMC2535]|uniref:hypothetical protein n=1 Tax=Pseudenhygromyxa sp. WMMC2535 TaxID=2712867 RepID=UPI00155574D0|nr:hypothetical protein [Pseudenhygromyxa sp. WMMC2535]NVB37242.1 hypothetical protein [Pseudenhygromyxa sp. WMMC2535]NVB43446.1 hypothetical protein [Pseudenhygromyxa sp. WMMC2535]
MLLRPAETYISEVTKRAERVFPQGSEWLTFASKMPGKEVLQNSVLDPAVGLVGELAMQAFASADWQNWISSMQIGVYELATRVGLPALDKVDLGGAVATVYGNITRTLDAFGNFENAEEVLPTLLKDMGLQVLQLIAANTGIIARTIAQVIAVAVWAVDVGMAIRAEELGKDVVLPPLQTDDPATDSWQVNRVFEVFRELGTGGIVYPDGKIEPAYNADYTSLYLPAYRHDQPWTFQHREDGIAAQQGTPQVARGPKGDTEFSFDPGDGSTFGFMPGTMVTLRVLQASYRFYYSVRGTSVDRYTLRCKGVDKPCYKGVKTFDGSRDCRQCVDPESVWPTEGVGWAYGGAPLNASTPGENVGAFYPSTNKLLLNTLDMISRPGPLLYTLDTEAMIFRWKNSFEKFWIFAEKEWLHYKGQGWRGLISRLATLMTSFDGKTGPELGGREPDMPLGLIASPREDSTFSIPFEASVFSRIIKPFCEDLRALQAHYLDSFQVAYVPPGAGALYHPGGKLRSTALADRFMDARRALLNDGKRMLIDLRQVSDPEYRAELEAVGVKASPVNPLLKGPGVDGHQLLAPDIRPPRAPRRPQVVGRPTLTSANEIAAKAPRVPMNTAGRSRWRRAVTVGIGVSSAAVLAGATLRLSRSSEDQEG